MTNAELKADKLAAKVKAFALRWPFGSLVYHKADGKRGVVEGYGISAEGYLSVHVCWSAASAYYDEPETSISREPTVAEDGESWKVA